MFVVYCILEDDERGRDKPYLMEATDTSYSYNVLNLLSNLELPHLVIRVDKKEKKQMNFLRDMISKLNKNAIVDVSKIFLPQIFTIDVSEECEESVLEKLINFEDPNINFEGEANCIFYIGSFFEFKDLINSLFHLSPESINISDSSYESDDSVYESDNSAYESEKKINIVDKNV